MRTLSHKICITSALCFLIHARCVYWSQLNWLNSLFHFVCSFFPFFNFIPVLNLVFGSWVNVPARTLATGYTLLIYYYIENKRCDGKMCKPLSGMYIVVAGFVRIVEVKRWPIQSLTCSLAWHAQSFCMVAILIKNLNKREIKIKLNEMKICKLF